MLRKFLVFFASRVGTWLAASIATLIVVDPQQIATVENVLTALVLLALDKLSEIGFGLVSS